MYTNKKEENHTPTCKGLSSSSYSTTKYRKSQVTHSKLKLRSWVKYLLFLLLGALIGIIIYQLFTLKTTTKTPVGNYTCRGGIVRICSSSNKVAKYLGV